MLRIIRFFVGGLIVSLFSAFGEALRPKSFAGLFGTAPSVALATLGLTIVADGKMFAAKEARSMIAGALAFLSNAWATIWLIMKHKWHAGVASSCTLIVRMIFAVAAWAVLR